MRATLAMLICAACTGALAQEGRVVVAIGVCKESLATSANVMFRKVDKSAHFNASAATGLFSSWDYSDDTGDFKVKNAMLSAGEWELYTFDILTGETGGARRHRPKAEFSHRFKVVPGKVVDLGRYCAATQAVGEVFEDWPDRVFNQVSRLVYIHVSANREADLEKARDGAEVVSARPSPPERVSGTMRARFVEPRIIRKPAAPKPLDIPR